jgi:hypothetical protein
MKAKSVRLAQLLRRDNAVGRDIGIMHAVLGAVQIRQIAMLPRYEGVANRGESLRAVRDG